MVNFYFEKDTKALRFIGWVRGVDVFFGNDCYLLLLTTPPYGHLPINRDKFPIHRDKLSKGGECVERRGMLAFVGGGFVEGDEVEHGAHSAPDSVAVLGFDFGGGEVGGAVGLDVFCNE